MHQTHSSHYDTPENHDGRNEDGRFEALQENVGQGLKTSIGHEELEHALMMSLWQPEWR